MAEKEYIEREATLAYMSEVKAACTSNFEYEASAVIAGMICEIIDGEIPAADVAPVRHGRWIINSDGYYPQCSECMSEPRGREMTKYCSDCGALMDGDKYD